MNVIAVVRLVLLQVASGLKCFTMETAVVLMVEDERKKRWRLNEAQSSGSRTLDDVNVVSEGSGSEWAGFRVHMSLDEAPLLLRPGRGKDDLL